MWSRKSGYYFSSKKKYKVNGEIIIIELKVNSTEKEAIKHIHRKKYYNGLKEKGYYGNIY